MIPLHFASNRFFRVCRGYIRPSLELASVRRGCLVGTDTFQLPIFPILNLKPTFIIVASIRSHPSMEVVKPAICA